MNIFFIGMVISMLVYIVLGVFISRGVKNANDYYVAGRKAPTILIVGSLVASYCSSGLFMGDAVESYNGFFAPVMILTTMQTAGYIFGSVFFGRYLRRSSVFTIPEFLGKRFCSSRMRALSSFVAIVTMTLYLLGCMQGIGVLMNAVTKLDYNICILLALITFTTLTVLSGSKGVLITDTIMFGIFTVASLVFVVVVANKAGGWYSGMKELALSGLADLSWSGDLNHLYPTGAQNFIWAFLYGLVWMFVCATGPWQSSRYLMAKNEHIVIRSSVWAALGVFALEFFVCLGINFVHVFAPDFSDNSFIIVWTSMNVLPVFLGVIMLTGILAAAISSATTFLSLISSSVTNDILKVEDSKGKVRVGRITTIIISLLVMLLAYFNPPQIFWIMSMGGAIIASAWFPVCIASIWYKKMTKTGAFLGMLFGLLGCGITKFYSVFFGFVFPVWLDPFVIGVIADIVGIFLGSKFTVVSRDEKKARDELFIVPQEELDESDMKKTKRSILLMPVFGIAVSLILFLFWVFPYAWV